jgi:hypothetical protein
MGCGGSTNSDPGKTNLSPAERTRQGKRGSITAAIDRKIYRIAQNSKLSTHQKYIEKMRVYRDWFVQADVDDSNTLGIGEVQ